MKSTIGILMFSILAPHILVAQTLDKLDAATVDYAVISPTRDAKERFAIKAGAECSERVVQEKGFGNLQCRLCTAIPRTKEISLDRPIHIISVTKSANPIVIEYTFNTLSGSLKCANFAYVAGQGQPVEISRSEISNFFAKFGYQFQPMERPMEAHPLDRAGRN